MAGATPAAPARRRRPAFRFGAADPRPARAATIRQNGFRGADGAVYAIPQRSTAVLRVLPDPRGGGEDAVELLELGPEFAGCKEKFEGGVMGADGSIYCIPLRAKRALKVVPGG